jgi:site-specific recombinase XerD
MSIDQSSLLQKRESSALRKLVNTVESYVRQSIAENTKQAYQSDWNHFESWCHSHGLEAAPAEPETVAGYISAMASGDTESGRVYAASTIQRRLTSIRVVHESQGFDDPTDDSRVRQTWQGIRRDADVQTEEVGRKALLSREIHQIVDTLDENSVKGRRDRALILLGFATGMRRSELVSLEVRDLEFKSKGLVVHIRQSKTDQEGQGRKASVHHSEKY